MYRVYNDTPLIPKDHKAPLDTDNQRELARGLSGKYDDNYFRSTCFIALQSLMSSLLIELRVQMPEIVHNRGDLVVPRCVRGKYDTLSES